MRCEIVYDMIRREHTVFFLQEDSWSGRGTALLVPRGGRLWEQRVTHEGMAFDADGSFTMTPEMLDAFVLATRNSKLPSEATQDHLKDAITIRDRLLGLIERNSMEHGKDSSDYDHGTIGGF